MASAEAAGDSAAPDSSKNQFLFWGCFAALIATAFGFQVRAMLMLTWGDEFGLSPTEQGEIFGAGLWPFAVSIILLSLVIDRIGYGKAATEMTARMDNGVPQEDGWTGVEATMNVRHVADAIVYMASLPRGANVSTITVMATTMPLVGRG